ncbi:hypothetical protein BDZ89DRAFT_1064670 [Hymenopellis radicata]|nr:hypothetical protein BDZ89DRAFT_1064670 [Hymenopellis radicata]
MGGVWSAALEGLGSLFAGWFGGNPAMGDNPTMNDIDEHLRREREAAERLASENARRAEEAERDRQAAEERARQSQEDARRREEEARNARESAEKAERDRQAADDHARRFQEEAHHQAEEARKARERAETADQEKRQAEEDTRRFQEEAERQKEQAQKARDDLRRGAHPDIWPTLEQFESTKRRYGYTSSMVHIAVAGISGCGKSSLVNSFRGLSSKSPEAAQTGIVETTTEVSSYADHDPSKPIIWFDVPGAGTLNISDWDYFNAQGLFIFDAIVVVLADRFCATDIAILKACKKYCIPAYIVRSKSDRYIEDMMKDEASDEEDEADGDEDEYHEDHAGRLERVRQDYAEKTRRNVKRNLKQAGLPDQEVFLVSKTALLSIVGKRKQKPGAIVLDEEKLLKVMVGDGIKRRFKPTPALSSVLNRLGLGRMV